MTALPEAFVRGYRSFRSGGGGSAFSDELGSGDVLWPPFAPAAYALIALLWLPAALLASLGCGALLARASTGARGARYTCAPFSGVLCARLAAGDEMSAAMRQASAAASLSTTVAGAVPSLPRRAAIDELLSRRINED